MVWYRMLPILEAVPAKIAAPGKSLCSKRTAYHIFATANQISWLLMCMHIYILNILQVIKISATRSPHPKTEIIPMFTHWKSVGMPHLQHPTEQTKAQCTQCLGSRQGFSQKEHKEKQGCLRGWSEN